MFSNTEKIFVMLLVIAALFVSPGIAMVHISEVMADNDNTLMDIDGDASDWIELYNDSASAVDLAGWYLSDGPTNSAQWGFPSVLIPSNGFLVVFASGKGRAVAGAELHANFKLSASGARVALVQPDGITTESALTFPPQQEDISYGYAFSAGSSSSQVSSIELGSTGMLLSPTPGGPNTAIAYDGYCDTPIVHPERGFYDAPFLVTLSNVTEGAAILYTTNGSVPTESNSTPYTGPIPVDGTTLLRAVATKAGHQSSAPVTQTYLFIADLLQQDGVGLQPYANWGDEGQNDWAVDPTMTNVVITDMEGHPFQLADALLDVPTVSLVTDWDNWWSDEPGPALPNGVVPWQGIYADMVAQHADRRPVSMEFFTADGSEMFAENGRVSIVGGGIGGTSARRWKSDKLSMRVAFEGKLNYPVFGNDAARKFNGLFLDAHLAWCWTHRGAPWIGATPKFVSDALASDIQNSMGMGRGAPHSRFVHLYLNGLYWGMYDMHERPDEHFSAEYYGGSNEDYDSIKHLYDDTNEDDSDFDGFPYNDNITGGDDANLHAMFALARADLSLQSNYNALATMLDIEDLIDYLLMNFYLGNTDWAHKNWYATFNRNDPDGRWRYHSWDTEHIMERSLFDADLPSALAYDATGGDRKDVPGDPMELHLSLASESAEYRMVFADHIHRHFFNDGILTVSNATSAFWTRVQEIDRAMLGEAARWADNKAYLGYGDYDYSNWYNHMIDLRDAYFPYRRGVVLSQLKYRNLYPSTAAPAFLVNGGNQHGGLITPSDTLSIDSSHIVYYTTDGTDPRAVGGAVAGTMYSSPLSFNRPTLLKARALNGDEWSALCEAVFITEEVPIVVTELMYHAPGGNDQDFIEIQNISDEPIDLRGYKLNNAIDYPFRDSAPILLAPSAFMVAVKDIEQFSSLYSTNGMLIAGEYTGDFDNGGEKVELEFWNKDLITFRYSDGRDWPLAADGVGHSLVPLDSALADAGRGSLNYGGNWRASTDLGGSPGHADPAAPATIVLNEITAHTDAGETPPFEKDQIELFNPTTEDIVLSGWHLSDDLDERDKWAIPNGTMVPARGFVLFDEDDFHPGRIAGFGLDKAGEEVVLSAPSRVVDAFRFKGQENGAAIGRYPDGGAHWLTTVPTPAAPNQLAGVEVWIRALMYNPLPPAGHADGDAVEYIQLENRTSESVLFATSAGTWRIDGGVEYLFPDGFSLPAGETLWLVPFDPTDVSALNLFCSTYGLTAAEEIILGPYMGQLSNQGERVALERPQEAEDPLNPLDVYWVIVDELFYFDQSPWPEAADGTGYPLSRLGQSVWGVATLTDSDDDGLDDGWEADFFGSLAEGAQGDWDADGFFNLDEWICGTDPTNAASYFSIEEMDAPTLYWSAVPGRTYAVYWTGNLQTPFTQIASGLSTNQFTDTAGASDEQNYYFITVEME